MTSEGSRPQSDHRAERRAEHRAPARRRVPRVAAMAALVVAAGVTGTWAELSLPGSHHVTAGAGSTSQDGSAPAAGGQAADSSSGAGPSVNAAEVLPDASITGSGYSGNRSSSDDGGECTKVFPAPVPASASASPSPGASASPSAAASGSASASPSAAASASAAATPSPTSTLAGGDCQGYARADYVSFGNTVYTSVTVLGYPNRSAAAQAAGRITDSDIQFFQPGGGLPAMTPQAGDASLTGSVSAVGHFVTITVSAYADGHPADAALQTATHAVAFSAGQSLLWL